MGLTLTQVNGWLTLSNPREDREMRELARSMSSSRASSKQVRSVLAAADVTRVGGRVESGSR
jgi:hypothetical protein